MGTLRETVFTTLRGCSNSESRRFPIEAMSLPDLAAGGNSEGQRGYSSGHGSHDDNSVMSAGVSKSNKLTSSTNYHKERRILSTVESSCQGNVR